MYVNLIHYFKEDFSTGEITDKIWLGQDWKADKQFFENRKDMIKRATRGKYELLEIDKPHYYHKAVEAGDGRHIIYTLILKKKKVH